VGKTPLRDDGKNSYKKNKTRFYCGDQYPQTEKVSQLNPQ